MLLLVVVGVVIVVVFFALGFGSSEATFARVSRRSCAVANALGAVIVATAVDTIATATTTVFGSSRSTFVFFSSATPRDARSRKERFSRITRRGELYLPYSSLQPLHERVDTKREFRRLKKAGINREG